jgi:hypothetical protein
MSKKQLSSFPRCPNHGCALEIDKKDMGKSKGEAPCPVSGAMFDWEMKPETESKVVDKYGNVTTVCEIHVDGNE